MFIDHTSSLPTPPPSPQPLATPPSPLKQRKNILIIAGLAVIIVIAAGSWWYLNRGQQPIAQTPTPTPAEPVSLPETLQPNENDINNEGNNNSDIQGETITFNDFYKPLNEPLEITAKGVALPMNAKSQVSNYYDVARKIDLDSVVTTLNRDGFALLGNPFTQSPDFFGVYAELAKQGVPSIVTSDFLLYYYGNSLKQIYKDIESSYFYEGLWNVNKRLFDISNARYQERRQKVGLANDSLLEAERLEASYFALSLVLLSPTPEQVNPNEELSDSRKFKPSEAKRYEFAPPAYLADDLNREATLIRQAKASAKSPIFRYDRNYADFKIPAEYAQSASLSNFYLASRWQSSLFPLNYRDADCSGCLLDKEDWIINQTAAFLVAEDMSSDQSVKNSWAKLYKVISFFTGLRSELTYLHYQNVRAELFDKKSSDEIFTADAFNNLLKLRTKLQTISFSAAEGGLPRSDAALKPVIGMRLLQTPYWPDQYIHDRFIGAAVGSHNQPKNPRGGNAAYLTACSNDKEKQLYRCRGLGFDVIGAVNNYNPAKPFLKDNTNYKNYAAVRAALTKELEVLPAGTWHGNNFWSTLSLIKTLLADSVKSLPYFNSGNWADRKLTAGLATLTQLSVPADTWEIARQSVTSNLEGTESIATLNYVEPNSQLADELVAHATMLSGALGKLGVVKENDSRFSDLITKLSSIRTIIRQELTGAPLSNDQYQFLSDFTSQYRVIRSGGTSAKLTFTDPLTKRSLAVQQTIAPLGLAAIVYNKDDKQILAIGPVYSYKEEVK